jgi:acyl-CoA dehydrogenase
VDFLIPDEYRSLCATIRRFTEERVDAAWRQIERDDEIPEATLSAAADLGLFGLTVPTEYGGLGLPMLARALIYEELGRTHAGFTSIIGTHCGIGTTTIVSAGSDEQKARYLPRLATGEWIGAFALTEPEAGSDAASIRTRAERVGDDWVLTGTKHFITNARLAHLFTVFAVTDASQGASGISAFLVERDTPGFSVGATQAVMGLRGSHACELIFDECRIPANSLLGAEGLGYKSALRTLAQGRIGIASRCVGAAQRVLEFAVDHSRLRRQFGRPIAEFQLVQAHLAESATDIEAARRLCQYAAWLVDEGRPVRREAAMAKLFATEMYGRAVDRSLQVHGGTGYTCEHPVEHYYRDARITRIYEGTSEIQKLIIARELVRGS